MGETRADRAKAIRDELSETQRQFAERLTATARALGFDHEYTENLVSKIEGQYRDTSIDDIAVYEEVDPAKRGWFWFAFGRDRPARRRASGRGAMLVDPDAKEAGGGKKRA